MALAKASGTLLKANSKGYYLYKALSEGKLTIQPAEISSTPNTLLCNELGFITTAASSTAGTQSRGAITRYTTDVSCRSMSWEIGCRFKIFADGNNALFGYSNNIRYAYCPTIEAHPTKLWFGVPDTSGSWTKQAELSLSFDITNKWLFVKMSFTKETKKIVVSATEDYDTWYTNDSLTLSNDSANWLDPLTWNGFVGSSNVGLHGELDFLKSYVKDGNGTILTGCDIDPRFYR